MSTALATRPAVAPATIDNPEERDRLVRALILKDGSDDEVRLVLALCDRYGLDPLLKHIVLVSNNVYITRDGLLHLAHQSGQLDGIAALAWRDEEDGRWVARCTVTRKDWAHPIVYEAYEAEHKPDHVNQRSAWGKYPRAMTVKCAEVAALRRAFNVALPVAEEIGWDGRGTQTSRGTARVVEATDAASGASGQGITEPDPPAGKRTWTVESALAYIADVQKPQDKRVKLAKWVLSQANDLPTITQYRAALVPLLDEDLFADHYLARYEALGGVLGGGEEEPIEADFEARPDGARDEEPA